MPGERRGLGRDALLEVAVGRRSTRSCGRRRSRRGPRRGRAAPLVAGRHRHADGVAEALAERSGGGLDARGVPVLGVPGRAAAPGAEGLEVVEREAVAGQVQLDVQGEAGVPERQHEAVAPEPGGVAGVVAQEPSGRAGRRRAPGSWPCRGGRCRPSGRRPWPGPGRCRRRGGRGRSSRSSQGVLAGATSVFTGDPALPRLPDVAEPSDRLSTPSGRDGRPWRARCA